MVQLVCKFLFCVLATIATSQICECKVSSFPLDDEEIFPDQMTEDDIESAELQNELWDFRPPSDSFTIRDLEEEEGALPEEGDGRSKRSMSTLNSITHREKRATKCWHVQGVSPDMTKCRARDLEEIIQDASRNKLYYYIGYTSKGEFSSYIKTTRPKSGPKNGNWKFRFDRQAMYYADITGTTVTEADLVRAHIRDPFCVNGPTAPTVSKNSGIVYVVVGQDKTGKDEGYDSDAIRSESKIWARSGPFRDVLDKIEYLLRLNRFE